MKDLDKNDEKFRDYLEQVHGVEEKESEQAGSNKVMRTVFAIIMILIYIGVGVCLLINLVGWGEGWTWVRWFIGILLIIYGGFRAYRQFIGIN